MKSTVVRRLDPIVAGFLAVVSTTALADVFMHVTGLFPRSGEPMAAELYVLPLTYRVAFAILGGYVTARLAAAWPMRQALRLGAIGLAIGLVGTAAAAGQRDIHGPEWYFLLVALTAVPCSWAGAKLYLRPRATLIGVIA